ncbi:glucosaminidase domain-containing protein [Actinosynnema sp. NPDC020468]|uniref:glucosaminidase domain-containing protein n=1 Tax=Actinosynnema sp. NPDC020468 TaxID=3154488 RepID=UPI0033D7641C
MSRNLLTRIALGGLAVLATFGLAAPVSATPDLHATANEGAYIESSAAAAIRVHTEYGLPASVALAQSIHESAWGTSGLATADRNFFGIKCVSAGSPGPIAASCSSWPTTECDQYGCHGTNAYFRSYRTKEDSFRDYGALLTTSTYSRAWPYRNDPKRFIREIAASGYATDPNYANLVIATMDRYNLYRFDTTVEEARSEGGPVLKVGNTQHHFAKVGTTIKHRWWQPDFLLRDEWGGQDVAGEPVTFLFNGQQHLFYRSTDGSLKHVFYIEGRGKLADTWAGAGSITGDPAAMVIGDTQHVWATDANGKLQHWFWADRLGTIPLHDEWAQGGTTGRPSAMTVNGQQHVFVRGTGGSLEHYFWIETRGVLHDTWTSTGVTGDPTALLIGNQQHVFATTSAGALGHWYWSETLGSRSDQWAPSGLVGRPAAFVVDGQQHVFVRGVGGTLEHYFWIEDRGVLHDTWGTGITGDPSAAVFGDQQHAFAPGANGTLRHFFWSEALGQREDDWGV